MQTLIRDVLVSKVTEISDLADLYANRDPNFVDRTASWLERTEKSVAPFRMPLSGFLAAKRTALTGAQDGLVRADVSESARRKTLRASTASIINEVEREIRSVLASSDALISEMSDRMAQLYAIASQEVELPPESTPREAWLTSVWRAMDVTNGARPIHSYLTARLSRTDRLYILDMMLRNLDGIDSVP